MIPVNELSTSGSGEHWRLAPTAPRSWRAERAAFTPGPMIWSCGLPQGMAPASAAKSNYMRLRALGERAAGFLGDPQRPARPDCANHMDDTAERHYTEECQQA
jgi:hypothetical protein